MRLDRIAAALAATLLLGASPDSGASSGDRPWIWPPPAACTREARMCLEKLDARLALAHGEHDWNRMQTLLLDLYATDPECALALQGMGWAGN
jgi:hypothetical protein